MANFSRFFPEDVPAAGGGQVHREGDIVVFNDNFYGATGDSTLSDPVVATDFDTNWVLLSDTGGGGGGGAGGTTPLITSINFITSLTDTTVIPGTHGFPGRDNFLQINGSNFAAIASINATPTVMITIGGTTTMLQIMYVGNSQIRARVPSALIPSTGITQAQVVVVGVLGSNSDPFNIEFSNGPSLTAAGTLSARMNGMINYVVTATGDTPITFALDPASQTIIDGLTWLTFTDNGNNTATFSGTVPMNEAAVLNPYTVIATDTHGQTERATYQIGVLPETVRFTVSVRHINFPAGTGFFNQGGAGRTITGLPGSTAGGYGEADFPGNDEPRVGQTASVSGSGASFVTAGTVAGHPVGWQDGWWWTVTLPTQDGLSATVTVNWNS